MMFCCNSKKVQEHVYGLDFKSKGAMEFITLRPLVAPLLCSGTTAKGLRVINSIDPCVLKSNYYLVAI